MTARRFQVTVFQIEVHKRATYYQAPGEEWSNVYHCNATDLANARTTASAIVTAEQGLYGDGVTIYKYHLKEYLNPAAQAITEYISFVGTLAPIGDVLPNWNVARMDWNAPPATRSVRKYMRSTIDEDAVVGQLFASGYYDVLTAFATAIAEEGSICNPDGVLIDPGDFRVDNRVAMRQTGWSRRSRPGFHRAYVPNA